MLTVIGRPSPTCPSGPAAHNWNCLGMIRIGQPEWSGNRDDRYVGTPLGNTGQAVLASRSGADGACRRRSNAVASVVGRVPYPCSHLGSEPVAQQADIINHASDRHGPALAQARARRRVRFAQPLADQDPPKVRVATFTWPCAGGQLGPRARATSLSPHKLVLVSAHDCKSRDVAVDWGPDYALAGAVDGLWAGSVLAATPALGLSTKTLSCTAARSALN